MLHSINANDPLDCKASTKFTGLATCLVKSQQLTHVRSCMSVTGKTVKDIAENQTKCWLPAFLACPRAPDGGGGGCYFNFRFKIFDYSALNSMLLILI